MSEGPRVGEGATVRAASSTGHPVLEALALLVFVVVFARGREHAVDLHLWDELVSYWAGHDLVRGLVWPDLAWSPLHALVYGLLSLAPVEVPAVDAMALFVFAAVVLAAHGFVRALAPPWLATGFAMLLAWSPVLSQQSRVGQPGLPTVYAFALALALVAAALQARGRTAAAAIALGLAASSRSELVPWFAGFAAFAIALPPLRRRRRLAVGLGAVALALLCIVVLSPPHRDRSWLAFCQHYARQACLRELALEWERAQGKVDPERLRLAPFELQRAFDDPSPWIARELPGATSLGSAILVAPQQVFAHMEQNLLQLPTAVATALRPAFASEDAGRNGFFAATGLALVGLLVRRKREPQLLRTDERRLWPWLAGASVLSLVGPLLVAARSELCLPVAVLVLGFLAHGLAGLLPARWREPSPSTSWAAIALAGAFALVAACSWVPVPFAGSTPALRHRDEVAMLQRELPAGPVVLLSWWWDEPLRLLGRSDVERRSLWGVAAEPFAPLLDAWKVTAVLVTPELEFELQRFADAKAVLAASPWRLANERGEVRLYVR